MGVTVKDVLKLVAPEFAEQPDATLDLWLELTAPLVSKKRFGKLYNQALAFLTAHRMKLTGVGVKTEDDPLAIVGGISAGNLSRVSSFSEGEVSISFNHSGSAQAGDSDAELASTEYGIQFQALARLKIMSIVSAGEARG